MDVQCEIRGLGQMMDLECVVVSCEASHVLDIGLLKIQL